MKKQEMRLISENKYHSGYHSKIEYWIAKYNTAMKEAITCIMTDDVEKEAIAIAIADEYFQKSMHFINKETVRKNRTVEKIFGKPRSIYHT
jgi:hypothetical protein